RVHLPRVGDRLQRLLLERGRPPVPEEGGVVGDVEQTRGVAAAGAAVGADGRRAGAGEPVGRVVAGGAGDGAVGGQVGVEEQPPAEAGLGRGERVVGRGGGPGGQAGGDGGEVEVGRQGVGRHRRRPGRRGRQRDGQDDC